jgi:macrodomain Ter protein organizer (MatP/YcbG family)
MLSHIAHECMCMYVTTIDIINTTYFFIYNVKSESRSVNIDFELWKKAEVLAIDKGITITEFIEEAIREKIDKEKDHQIQS